MSYREGGDGSPAERKTSFGRSEDYSTPVKSFVQMTPNNCTTEYKNKLTEEIPYVNNNHSSRKLPAFERIETDRFNAEHHPTGTVTDVDHNQDIPCYRQEENYNVNMYSKEHVVPTAIPRHNTSYNNFDRHHTTYHVNEEYTNRRSPNYNNNSIKENNERILKDEIDRLNQELLNLHREHKKYVIQFNNENKKLREENYQLKNKINEFQQLCVKEKTFCDVRNEKNQQIILKNIQLKRKLNQLNQDHSKKKASTTEQNHPHDKDNQQEVVQVAHDNEMEVSKSKKSKTINQINQQRILSDDEKCSNTGDGNTPTSFQEITSKESGNINAPQGTSFHGLIRNQETQYNCFKENKPSPDMNNEKITALELIGFESTSCRVRGTWDDKFQELVKFKEDNGHMKVPSRTSLSIWINHQRQYYKNLKENKTPAIKPEHIPTLESIGFEWSVRNKWDDKFQELVKFKEANGHMKVPNGTSLGNWIRNQRTGYKNLKENKTPAIKPEHIPTLESIGFEWSTHRFKGTWDERFLELVKFKEDNGHMKVPTGTSLSYWIDNQKSSYKKFQMDKPSTMTSERIFKLESIGIKWRK